MPPEPAGAPAADGLPAPRRWLAAGALWLAMAVTVLDSAIANVALPTIAPDLAASAPASLWVIHIYQLAVVCSILTFAAIGDIHGYRRVYLAGLMVFTVASCACAASATIGELIAWRLVQGLGASAIMSVNGALVRFTFPARQLGQAFGINAVVIAISATAAPAIAGVSLALVSWRWLFGINLVFGALALIMGWRALPGNRGQLARLDALSAVMTAGAMASLFGASAIGLERESGVLIGAGLAACAVLAVPVYRRAHRQDRPLLPVDLMAMPVLRRAYLASICNFAAQTLLLVGLPFYLRTGLGYSALRTGLTVAAIPLGLALAAPLAGRWADRSPRSEPGRMGLPLAVCGLLGLAAVPADRGAAMALAGLVCGIGFGLFQAPNNRTMTTAAPPARSGAAAGMLGLSRLCGQMTGVVIAGLLLRHLPTTNAGFSLVAAAVASLGAILALGRSAALVGRPSANRAGP
ncbi:MAG: MFS transporter [Novosphingobium sp.]|nr:MFS transporter [Novosphingobium sp.]